MIGKICGTGSCVPGHILDNDDLSQMVDTSDAWIRERTGVARRHIIEGETTVTMAAEAARRALENGNVQPEEVDLLIVCTFTSEVLLPCAACEVQKELGAVHAACFDLNAACTGFLFAYNTAQAYITAGMCRTVLLIGSESLSNMVNWKDRGTCILFGDGAGAAVLRAEPGELPAPVMHSDGASGGALTLMSRHRKGREKGEHAGSRPDACPAEQAPPGYGAEGLPIQSHVDQASVHPEEFIRMDGREVFRFAVKKVPEAICELLDHSGMVAGQIDYFLLHQANRRIVESVAKRLDVEIEKFPMNLEEYGNTSSASIPILLDEMNRDGRLKPGQTIVLAGFGAGLSWGAAVLKWQPPKNIVMPAWL